MKTAPPMNTFDFFQVLKLRQPVTLQPLEANGQVVPFWKPPIS